MPHEQQSLSPSAEAAASFAIGEEPCRRADFRTPCSSSLEQMLPKLMMSTSVVQEGGTIEGASTKSSFLSSADDVSPRVHPSKHHHVAIDSLRGTTRPTYVRVEQAEYDSNCMPMSGRVYRSNS